MRDKSHRTFFFYLFNRSLMDRDQNKRHSLKLDLFSDNGNVGLIKKIDKK